MTGFRVSPGGAQARYGVTPDLTTMAKILAGGLPGGAVAGRADIISLIEFRDDPDWNSRQRVLHPGTFNANPLSAAAGVDDAVAGGDGRASTPTPPPSTAGSSRDERGDIRPRRERLRLRPGLLPPPLAGR